MSMDTGSMLSDACIGGGWVVCSVGGAAARRCDLPQFRPPLLGLLDLLGLGREWGAVLPAVLPDIADD